MSNSSGDQPKVASQGGVLEGMNPADFNPADPIVLFIIQAIIIIVACRLLHWPLSKIRQPTVIAEVIGGIILGPTVMGQIPGYMATIFPKDSLPMLSLAANLGLILFLFLVGLEVDLRVLTKNWKTAASVSALGMILPFGLGAALAYGLYNQFSKVDNPDADISFGVYLLFIGVAMAITAFPVLARILTELKLLQTDVGTIVLSAGVGNDVVGWILLALTVTLVNASNGLTALYIFLTCVGYILFLIYAVRPVFIRILRWSGSLENGPTQSMVGLTLLMVLASSFFTNIIGVHAIFGGFLIGLICPHEGGFAVQLTEKMEDLVTVIFLPLYFALSGLKTNIGLLDSGIVWGYVFAVVFVAFFAKIAGGTLAARANGLVWRESLTIGVLMSCKGLVELIVLNIGYQADILSDRVFTIFVVMALVTTFATTPLTTYLYPPAYQKKLEAWKRGEINWDGSPRTDSGSDSIRNQKEAAALTINRVTVLLRLENLPTIFTFVDLIGGSPVPAPKVHKAKAVAHEAIVEESVDTPRPNTPAAPPRRRFELYGVRLVELDQRMSTVMQVSEVGDLQNKDPVVNVFRTFGSFHNLSVSAGLSIAPEDSFAEVLANQASARFADLLLIPWTETGSIGDSQDVHSAELENRFTSYIHNRFVANTLAAATCSTAIMVDRGFGGNDRGLSRATSRRSLQHQPLNSEPLEPLSPVSDPSHHIFLPFFGGVDDHLALRFVLQLAANIHVTATIVHIIYDPEAPSTDEIQAPELVASKRHDLPRRLSHTNVPTVDSKDQADTTVTEVSDADASFFAAMSDSLPNDLKDRVLFETIRTPLPLQYTVVRSRAECGLSSKNAGDLLVMGRGATMKRPYIRKELASVLENLQVPSGAGAETRRCLGDVAEALIVAHNRSSVLVLQAGGQVVETLRREGA
ncbi:hypothetical protein EX30DRAFT_31588 [Ascodesmis nigricans]|uniref:Cation/H+ exchanger transmembrane domain-containing protein n=1 Tax=Ascodesmis nigricans TaxID=341454 RepID=A0A4S2N8K8_9PEZI|nr:hypothetical protein EX30DRAFT_31588 [Ascodesmis nigricans]